MSTKLIRRVLIASGLFVGALASFSPAAYADADDVVVENPVLQSVDFTSTATVGNPITLTANTALSTTSIGAASVKSNDEDGFTLTVDSTNSGLLTAPGGETIAYTLNVTGGTVASPDLTTSAPTVEDRALLVADCADSDGCNRPLAIAIAAPEMVSKPAGNYTDTLTFTIANK